MITYFKRSTHFVIDGKYRLKSLTAPVGYDAATA